LHLVAFAMTFGSAVWMTFISGAILSRSIPREQFRSVQTKMFPYFLKFMAGGEFAMTVLFSIMGGASRWRLISLILLVALTCFNAFVLEPETTKIYIEMFKLEKEEGRGLNETNSMSKELAEKKKKVSRSSWIFDRVKLN